MAGPINLSPDGNDHAATGAAPAASAPSRWPGAGPTSSPASTDVIGTFVSMRGGHEYPALIRKTDPKPIRIFLEDGSTDAWNPLFGSWYDAN
jgi:gluconolactonase